LPKKVLLGDALHSWASAEKIFRGRGPTEKTRPKNSTNKPLSTLSLLRVKIQEGHGPSVPRCQRPWLHSLQSSALTALVTTILFFAT